MNLGISGYALAFLVGVCSLQYFTYLPSINWLYLLPVCLVILRFSIPARWLLVCFIAILWALLHAHIYHARLLPESLAGIDIWVEGIISDIPTSKGRVQRFTMKVTQLQLDEVSEPGKLRLSWYGSQYQPRAGEKWRLLVRLKPPHGFMNPGGFDYERWLYQQGVHATGYVRKHGDNRKLANASMFDINQYRQLLLDQLTEQTDRGFNDLIAALSVGYKADISDRHWQVLTRSGTNHLMAISGLHIGLVAGMVFWLVRRLCPASLTTHITSLQIAACVSLVSALVYALLAGFAIPTQRALVMLAVVMGAVLFKRQLRPLSGLSLALIAVLLFDPLSVLSIGFWFSFMAVAVIAYCLTGRLKRDVFWLQWGKMQWILAIGLLPFSLFVFQQGSIVAPLANFILVPWVSFLVVPLVLLATVCSMIHIPLADFLFNLTNASLAMIWPFIRWFSDWSLASLSMPQPEVINLLLFLSGVILLLMPRGLPGRSFSLMLFLPLALSQPEKLQQGEFETTLLDVGQGLAVFIATAEHQLLFDTGPRFSSSFDTGDKVILPFFKYRGIDQLDKLVVSHGDNDHIGGAQSILDKLYVTELVGQDLVNLNHPEKIACMRGDSWQWDGVKFEFLHPDSPENYQRRNNRACVLKVESASGRLLIASDIENRVEQHLARGQPDRLQADVLIVPHHGSRTSSSMSFIKMVSPELALVSAGYRNRFGHPRQAIVERYRANDVRLLNTAESGAVKLAFPRGQSLLAPVSYRKTAGRYWNHW